ncbi:MAG: M4 family metallopeptidase [Gammaproteobacteria bacterium]|nr:M4 family metallopeptidase [Gammaproteobacteria bacterium]MCW8992580.1 M4 family metallopeptidase [Gammaproteobacteria bacterium]
MGSIVKHRCKPLTVAITLMLASASLPSLATAADPEQQLLKQGARIAMNPATNRPIFIGSTVGKPLTLSGISANSKPDSAAMSALQAYAPLFGLRDPAAELRLLRQFKHEDGRATLRYRQTYQGLPVIGGELVVNLNKDNALLSLNGEAAQSLKLAIDPAITAGAARDTALAAVAKWHGLAQRDLQAGEPELSILDPKLLRPGIEPASLVWSLEVKSRDSEPVRELVLVDAQRGHISLHFNQIHAAMDRKTYTAGGTADLPGTLVCDESDPTCSAGSADAKAAHQFAKDTYDFYTDTHGRDGIDDAGSPIISTVHWDDGGTCPNAFWDGSQMVYCDGLVVDDIVAHELTHGVTQNTSNLFYYYQSGAINESLSDVWGEFVDLSNTGGNDDISVRWEMGEDADVIGGSIRDMANPPTFNDPDKMSSTLYWTSAGDNGGVHINSGINNKAVYLMVDGDSFNGQSVTGIGIDKVAQVYYEVQTNLLTSGSDYFDLYHALDQGCQNLIGSNGITSGDCGQVMAAAEAVEMHLEPETDFNPDAELCPAGTTATGEVFHDDFENGLANWTLTGSPGWTGVYASYGVSYASSGIESLYGENAGTTSDQQAAFTITVPTTQPYLHFHHAFDFEAPNWDGGVLEYSADGSNWIDAGVLIDEGQHYNGTLTTSSGNPLEGRSAFVATSHGYVSTRVDLSSLAGQNVQFRWRVGTDSLVSALGWFLDDVRVYSCVTSNGLLGFSTSAYSANEGDGSVTIKVSRDVGSTGAVSIDYAVSSGSATAGEDYTLTAGTLNWADGDMADKSISVTLANDGIYEDNETVSLTLSNPTGGAGISTVTTTLTIIDDDPAPELSFTAASSQADEGDGSATISVVRSTNSNGAVSINYTVNGGTAQSGNDYNLSPGTLSWADGDSASKSITITLIDDDIDEKDETVILALSGANGAIIGDNAMTTLTIVDNDSSGGGGGGALGLPLLILLGLLRMARLPGRLKA